MAGHQNSNAKQRVGSGKLKKRPSCMQINIHSRLATDNLLKLIKENDTYYMYSGTICDRQ